MLRVSFLQQWYGLADEALEDAIYDSQAMGNFLCIDLSGENVSDATIVTAANVGEITQADALLHGEENAVHADAGYTGIEKRAEHQDRKVGWFVAEKRGRLRAMAESIEKEFYIEWERRKAQIRAKVEHLFHIVKNLFHYRKVRYRGLAKNSAQIYSLFALANLVIAQRSRRPA